MDRTTQIFNNQIDKKTIKKANKAKIKYLKKYGNDLNKVYHLGVQEIKTLNFMNTANLVMSDTPLELKDKPFIVGNIRMGFGHYRISMAIASCAAALGYNVYWFDLASFKTTGGEVVRAQNALYSLGSRLSQMSKLFNKFVWDPMNSEGFRKLTYNAKDQKVNELLVPIYHDLPKDVPFVATHAWPAQGAVHAGMTHVVNAIPDNWPMALHYSEGGIHCVQTSYAYFGYKILNGMAKKPLKSMPDDSLYQVGHYIDHELVQNIKIDTAKRLERINKKAPLRILITVGGAGAGKTLYLSMVQHLIPYIKLGKVSVFLNFGDHLTMWNYFKENIEGIENEAITYFDEYEKLEKFTKDKYDSEIVGLHCIFNKDIFEAVYSTNLLMRMSDLLITKPSELSFYPIPKLMMRHVGGHEVYGGYYAKEMGDATFECKTNKEINLMLDRLFEDQSLLVNMNKRVINLHKAHTYDGGYKVVKLAAGESLDD